MVKILELIKEGNDLYGITNHYTGIKLNPGDKFVFKHKKYMTCHNGGYTALISWWENCWLTRRIADILIGKRDYGI